jgi:hypothetical protein
MLTEKGFSGLLVRIQRSEGTLRQLVQDAVEDSLAYAIDRQDQGHGLDLRRLSVLQSMTTKMKSISNQRLSDYIKSCLVDGNGKSCIGWHDKEQQYKLLTKGTVASLPTLETRGVWFEFGKAEKPKDDFNFGTRLAALIKLAEKHEDKLSDADKVIINSIRSARLESSLAGTTAIPVEQARALEAAGELPY